jgi:hypothetical protein
LRWGCPGQHRSDRWLALVWPVTVSANAHHHT